MAVVIGTVIEMILPEGNCKKYIKVVIGIYIVFTIISPVITKFTGESISVSEELELDKYIKEAERSAIKSNSIESDNQNNIMNMYISGLKEDIVAKLVAKGYEVSNVEVEIVDSESYTINSMTLQVGKCEEESKEQEPEKNVSKVENVEKVNINLDENKQNNLDKDNLAKEKSLSNKDERELKEYLSSVYEVQEENITIN